jgi:crossover junction endodeoxyribonuclease RusA
MFPFEFTVPGPPLSHQTRNRRRLQQWIAAVARAAAERWPSGEAPAAHPLQLTLVYFHDGEQVRIDNDNLVKPIQDALTGLVYQDDRLIVVTTVRKRGIDERFRVRYMSRVLADAFIEGREFVYIRVDRDQNLGELY